MPEITVRVSLDDYYDFLAECNTDNLTPQEKIKEIITYYVIVRRNRRKLAQKVLDSYMTKESRSS